MFNILAILGVTSTLTEVGVSQQILGFGHVLVDWDSTPRLSITNLEATGSAMDWTCSVGILHLIQLFLFFDLFGVMNKKIGGVDKIFALF